MRLKRLLSALAVCLVAVGRPAAAQQPPSIRLSPSRVETTIVRGLNFGPFTLSNATSAPYAVRVFPVLLGQRRDGGIFVRDDAAALGQARAELVGSMRAFDFPPGDARSVSARVIRIPASGAFYGGMLFQATPRNRRPGQITNVLQLNASLLLSPTAARARARYRAGPLTAEQAGPRRLRVLATLANSGNLYARATGTLIVRNAGGEPVGLTPLAGPSGGAQAVQSAPVEAVIRGFARGCDLR
jgi:hypothetical protein